MSAKYKRVKQGDEALPAPLRRLTRAFSSITLAVILLCLVALYGVLGSVPFYFITIGVVWLGLGLVFMGATLAACVGVMGSGRGPGWCRAGVCLIGLVGAGAVTVGACGRAYRWIGGLPMFAEYKAAKLYKLPAIELNETEFFSWWPLQLILMLFVVNMVWATVRRIEFKFVNLGVLTVHTGIVTAALGAALYGQLKLEGDMFVLREDQPGAGPVSVFYDRITPALYVSYAGTPEVQFPLPELPRFNDYGMGELDIALHEREEFREILGEDLRITIPGFVAYGQFERLWVEAQDEAQALEAGPAITVVRGDIDAPGDGPRATLPANRPADRVMEGELWAFEYLHAPTPQRLSDLLTEAPPEALGAPHLLLIEVPGQNFREVRAVRPGETFAVGETGYEVVVEELGPYPLPFVTDGYAGAADTHARLLIQSPGPTKPIQRYALHRYPERTQDFIDGQRGDPDPAIRTVYLDRTKVQVFMMTGVPDAPSAQQIWTVIQSARIKPVFGPLPTDEERLPLKGLERGDDNWLHVVEKLERAVPAQRPVVTPQALRDPKMEGTYDMALVPVRIEVDRRDGAGNKTGETFSRTVWLRQMPYLERGTTEARPVTVDVPGFGAVRVAFSRERHTLPFAVALTDFTMTPYPGSEIPRDFQSDLLVYPVNDRGTPDGTPARHRPRLNHPAVVKADGAPVQVRTIKLSQAGWDPGDQDAPPMLKQQRDEQGRFINQQRFTILGVGNNVGIRLVALGGVLVAAGIPWAFYVKPWLVKRKARRFTASLPETKSKSV